MSSQPCELSPASNPVARRTPRIGRRRSAHVVLLALTLAGGWAVSGCTRTRDAGPYVEVPAGSFVRGWAADLQLERDKVAAIDLVGDLLLVRTQRNAVFALSADGGTVRWASQVLEPGRILGRPILVNDRIVFPAVDQLIVYTTQGRRDREIQLDRAIRSGLANGNGLVYLGVDYAGQSRLSRVSLTEPYVPIRWELMARGAISAAPAIYDGVIYSASGDGNVYAVTDQRLPIWALPGNVFATGGPIVADVRVDDAGLYIAGTDSKLYAIDRVNGRIRWQYFAGTPLTTPPFLTADSVYQFVPGKGVVALDKTTGEFNRKPRWNVESAVEALGADALHVFLRTSDNVILAVEKATGKPAFRTQRNDLAFFAPATATRGETRLFAATAGGQILGIRPITTGGMTGQIVRAPEAPQVTPRLGG